VYLYFLGAHDLILHILEPKLDSRATLQDIATHPWLQSRPRQDPESPSVISSLELSDSGSSRQTRDSIDESVDKSSPISVSNRMHFYSDYHGTVAHVSVASSFDDSLPLWENDDQSLSCSKSYGPNVVPLDIEYSSHCTEDKVITGDYILLRDNSVIDDCQRLLPGITSHEDFCKTGCGSTFGDELVSDPSTSSNFHFRPWSSSTYCRHQQLSDSGQVVPLFVASRSLPTTAEISKLPVSFSADSLEVFADGRRDDTSCDDSNTDEYHDCDAISVKDLADNDDNNDIDAGDIDDGDNSHCDNYDFADIDAVLDHIASDVVAIPAADADEGSQVSYDSLDDAV